MSKHTPGPWEVGEEVATAYQIRPCGKNRGVALALVVDRPYAEGMHGDPISRDQAHANARLIAAAPELLEALEDVMDRLVDRHENDYCAIKACAAIAKAKGEV